jgi:hypothetical protein
MRERLEEYNIHQGVPDVVRNDGRLPGNYRIFGGARFSVLPNGALTYPADNRTEPTPQELQYARPSIEAAAAWRASGWPQSATTTTPTRSPQQTSTPSAAPGTVAVTSGKGGSVTVGKEYDATLGGKPVKVSYDASGKRTVTPVVSTPSTPAAQSPTAPSTPSTSSTPSASTTSSAPERTYQQKLDDLRAAAAKATLTGPSKEAQALMSQRTRNVLGPQKLEAGIKSQQEVEKMKNQIGNTSTRSSTQTPQVPQIPQSTQSSALTPEQIRQYNQAVGALQNPLLSGSARGTIENRYNTMTPEQQSKFRDYLKERPSKEQELFKFLPPTSVKELYNNRNRLTEEMKSVRNEYNDLMEAYMQVCEQNVGVPIPPGQTAADVLIKMLPSKEKVIRDKTDTPVPLVRQAEEYSVYDEVIDYLLSEGYAENKKAAEIIMVNMSEEWKKNIIENAFQGLLFTRSGKPQNFTSGRTPFVATNPVSRGRNSPLPPPRQTPPRTSPGQLSLNLNTRPRNPPSTPSTTTNRYRPGATIRVTGPTNNFPELERFAADQGRRIVEPVSRAAGALAALRNLTPAGIAAAVLAPRPTAPGTLDAARAAGLLPRTSTRPSTTQPSARRTTQPSSPRPLATQPSSPRPQPRSSTRSSVTPRTTAPSPKPEDPDLARYERLRTTNSAEAEKLGMEIWRRKYQPAFSSTPLNIS